MTRIYFVRHAQPDKSVKDDRTRPLTQKGLTDSALVIDILKDKGIDVAICSPYKRSLDTIKGFTESQS
jgi:2,3-bisphosphoglycerate-dependent phosphoglycerate mutase